MISAVKTELPDLQMAIRRAQNRIKTDKPGLLRRIGEMMLKFSILSYTVRSRGGTSIGIKWKSLHAAYVMWKLNKGYSAGIGIRTGLLRRSHFLEIQGIQRVSIELEVRTVSIEGDTGYAKSFDVVRPIFPQRFPPEWLREIDADAGKWLQEIVDDELEEFT